MRTPLLACLTLSLTFAACGGGGNLKDLKKQGYDELTSGDGAKAAATFEKALAKVDPTADVEDYVELKVARCQALAKVDGDEAEAEFRALHEEITDPELLRPSEYSLVASDLLSAKANTQAVEVMHLGMQRFPENPMMVKCLENVQMAVKQSGDSAAAARLKGLGYAGGD